MDAQVAIVGAGPAGAAAAIALSQAGVRDVLLLDRDYFPRDKTCGSGLSPAALQVAEMLGVGGELRARSNPVDWVRFVTPDNEAIVMPAHGAAVVLLRRDFDSLLVERARSLQVSVEEGFRASELVRDGRRIVGLRSYDGRERRARFVLFADGAHSIFSQDPRPRRQISTLMGWWINPELPGNRLDLIFDRRLAPLYGWMFPETPTRVNIGICIDEHRPDSPAKPDLRKLFHDFIDDHYAAALRNATQLGKLKGHPIVYTTWISHCTAPGALWIGEAARVTNHATGEGISQALQSGVFAAEAVAAVLQGVCSEASAWRSYLWQHRLRFMPGFIAGHLFRWFVAHRGLDFMARAYNSSSGQRFIQRALGSALTGTTSQQVPQAYARLSPSGGGDRAMATAYHQRALARFTRARPESPQKEKECG